MKPNSSPNHSGVFIAIEGSDGSGKTAQFKLLAERLKAVGHEVAVFDFPRYDEPSSYYVRQYLNGHYGPAGQVSPYSASLFYALDRFEAAPAIREALEEGKVVLSNRYVGSNMAHQGAKFTNPAEQRGFFVWADSLEYNLLGIPRPNINIFLRVPAAIAYNLVAKKAPRGYTEQTHDVHEADIKHLEQATQTYDLLTQLFPKDFVAIDCTDGGELFSIPAISDKIWQAIGSFLPTEKVHRPKKSTFQLSPAASSVLGKDLQAGSQSQLKKGSTGPNPDYTVPIEKISLLLASITEFELAIPIKINSSWTPHKGSYAAYTLGGLPKQLTQQYKKSLGRLRELNQQIAKELQIWAKGQKHTDKVDQTEMSLALEATIPLAALVDIKIETSAPAMTELLKQLNVSSLAEANWLASLLKAKVGLLRPNPSDNLAGRSGSKTAQPEHLRQTLSKLAKTRLLQSMAAEAETVQLSSWWPRNEFNVLVDGIYPYSSLSRHEIEEELDHFSFDQKTNLMKSIAAQPDNPVLSQIHYQWDVLCDRVTLKQLLAAELVDDLQVQPASPRFGYDLPKIIEQAHLEDAYMECFDLSLELFSAFQTAGREELAGYALLQGHRIRCQFKTIAAKLVKASSDLRRHPANYVSLVGALNAQVKQVHPIIGDSLLSKKEAGQETAKAVKRPSSRHGSRSKPK